MSRKIRFFKDQMSKAGVFPKQTTTLLNQTHIDLDDVEVYIPLPAFLFPIPFFSYIYFFLAHQVKLGELEAELIEINANNDKLQRSYNELIEYKLVLEKVLPTCFHFISFTLLLSKCHPSESLSSF